MASAVDICNLALALLGDTATVASINPPEGSAQAQHCAQFYPIARNTLLETAAWGFATRRAYLAEVTNPWTMWQYAYAVPAASINFLAVLPKEACDDYSERFVPEFDQPWPQGYTPPPVAAIYTPQPYSMEVNDAGQQIVLTNVCDAVGRFTIVVDDTTKFSPLFVSALAYMLASFLAGPLIKGEEGAAQSNRCMAMAKALAAQAEASDANQRMIRPQVVTSWIAGR